MTRRGCTSGVGSVDFSKTTWWPVFYKKHTVRKPKKNKQYKKHGRFPTISCIPYSWLNWGHKWFAGHSHIESNGKSKFSHPPRLAKSSTGKGCQRNNVVLSNTSWKCIISTNKKGLNVYIQNDFQTILESIWMQKGILNMWSIWNKAT